MQDIGVLFDLDGTVLNTDQLIFQSFNYVFSKLKPDYILDETELLSFLGPPLMTTLREYFSGAELEEAYQLYQEFNQSKHKEYVTVYPGVREVLAELAQDYPLGIVTSKMTKVAYIGLDTFDLTKYFDCVIGAQEVTRLKPDPQGINLAKEILQVTKVFYVGDNASDIDAGKNAEAITGAVGWSPKGTEHLLAKNPDFMLTSMKDLIDIVRQEELKNA